MSSVELEVATDMKQNNKQVTKGAGVPLQGICQNIWILSRKEFYGYIGRFCQRAFAFQDPNKDNSNDYIILYSNLMNDDYDINHLKYLCRLTNFPLSNVLFTNMEYSTLFEDIIYNNELKCTIEDIVINGFKSKQFKYCYVRSYDVIKEAFQWQSELIKKYKNRVRNSMDLSNYIKFEMEKQDWVDIFGNKSILHRNINTLDKQSIAEQYSIDKIFKMPKGFLCESKGEIVKGYNLLNKNDAVIKDVLGFCGSGIDFVSNKGDLKRLLSDSADYNGDNDIDRYKRMVNVEENLVTNVSKDCIWAAVLYQKNLETNDYTLFGPFLNEFKSSNMAVQTGSCSLDSEFIDNKSDLNKLNRILCEKMKLFLNIIKPDTQGGFDFYINKNNIENDIYLVDINTARQCGSMAILSVLNNIVNNKNKLWQRIVMDIPIYLQKENIDGKMFSSFLTIYNRLKEFHLLYNMNNDNNGVMPFVFLKNDNVVIFYLFQDSIDELNQMENELYQLFAKKKARRSISK